MSATLTRRRRLASEANVPTSRFAVPAEPDMARRGDPPQDELQHDGEPSRIAGAVLPPLRSYQSGHLDPLPPALMTRARRSVTRRRRLARHCIRHAPRTVNHRTRAKPARRDLRPSRPRSLSRRLGREHQDGVVNDNRHITWTCGLKLRRRPRRLAVPCAAGRCALRPSRPDAPRASWECPPDCDVWTVAGTSHAREVTRTDERIGNMASPLAG